MTKVTRYQRTKSWFGVFSLSSFSPGSFLSRTWFQINSHSFPSTFHNKRILQHHFKHCLPLLPSALWIIIATRQIRSSCGHHRLLHPSLISSIHNGVSSHYYSSAASSPPSSSLSFPLVHSSSTYSARTHKTLQKTTSTNTGIMSSTPLLDTTNLMPL